MSAPTIRTKVTADTVDFDKGMAAVIDQLRSAGASMKSFGQQTTTSGSAALKKFSAGVKDAINELKPLGAQIVSVTKSIAKWGAASAAAAGVAGAAIIGTSLNSIKELRNLSKMSDVSTASLQRGAFAAKSVGVDMEEYAQALKDVNDRLGDFAATGAGPMVDFFEKIGPKVGITAAAFEGLNSEQSLALYIKSLEDANVSQQEMTFYMEAIAGDATKLIPLFANNAKQMKALKKEAKDLGIGLSEIDVKQAMNAQEQLSKVGAIIKNELLGAVVELAPFITAIGKQMVTWFKGIRQESGGLAGMIGGFMVNLAGYIDEIATVLAYVGKGVDVMSGIFYGFIAAVKVGLGGAMKLTGNLVKTITTSMLDSVAYLNKAFSQDLFTGVVTMLKRLNLSIKEWLLTPVHELFKLASELPAMFGGDMFKDSLVSIKAMQADTARLKKELDDGVDNIELDPDSFAGKLDARLKETKGTLQKDMNDIIGTGDQLIADGLALGVTAGESLMSGLTSQINTTGLQDKVKAVFDAVKAETINRDEDGNKAEDPALSDPSSPDQPDSPTKTYASELEAFYSHTDSLLEAELFRFQSQNEIKSQQYNNEIQMLMDKQATEEGLTQTQEDKLNALKEKSVNINKELAKESMMSGIQMLLQGSSKASKIMKKFAIVQAILKGKEAAVAAWSAGMATGGPFAPVVAAAYTAASIGRTAGMINAIRGGGSSSGGGGGAASAAVSAGQSQGGGGGGGQSAPTQPNRIFNVEFAGQSSTSTQQTRNLLELINEQAGDNVTINMRG